MYILCINWHIYKHVANPQILRLYSSHRFPWSCNVWNNWSSRLENNCGSSIVNKAMSKLLNKRPKSKKEINKYLNSWHYARPTHQKLQPPQILLQKHQTTSDADLAFHNQGSFHFSHIPGQPINCRLSQQSFQTISLQGWTQTKQDKLPGLPSQELYLFCPHFQ